MKEILIRITSPSPSFFKKIGKLGLALTAIGGILVVPGIAIPASLIPIGGYLITGGLVAAAVAKVTVSDDSLLPKE